MFSTISCGAKNAHVASIKYVTQLSAEKAVKDSSRVTQFSAKENAKLATFPELHPIKTAYVCLADLDDDPLTELWTFYWPDDECS